MAATAVKTIQDIILEVLERPGSPLTLQELIEVVNAEQPTSSGDVRSALLPLITIQRVELTNERKLKLAGK